jgi:hypothetical protein
MGNGVGTFHHDEVKDLSPGDREELKRQTLQQLETSQEIRAIINSNPELLTKIPEINAILRKNLTPVWERMPKS